MNRLERLINLLAALIDTERPLAREEIQERITGYPEKDESFRRQFERDKDTLRSMGVPIAVEAISESEPHLGTGYRVLRAEYELPDPALDAEETAALHLAASSVRFLDEGARAAVLKLGGVAGVSASPEPDVEVPGGEHLEALFAAISDSRRVEFAYQGDARQVIPARLAFRNGHWYLSAWDEVRSGERMFRLDRVSGQVTPGDRAQPPAGAAAPRQSALPPWEFGDAESVEACLWVDAAQADLATRQAGSRVGVTRNDDGSAVLTLAVRNRVGFRNFVLGFLDHAEVLSPPEFREDMISWLEAAAR
jgi:predicted DNA-binding transcriptional regulator YafY